MPPVLSLEAQRSSSRRTTMHRGATAFELIAVLLSVGIIAAIVFPEASRMLSRQRLRAAAEVVCRAVTETAVLIIVEGLVRIGAIR